MNADVIEAEVWAVVRRVMDDKEYLLRKVRERFAEKRRELTESGKDAGVLVRQLEETETRWVKYQRAYEADAISVADLAEDRERVKDALERVRDRDAELEKLAETERSVCDRIQEGYGNLDEASPQQRREIYQDLSMRVEVGADKRPKTWGVFPMQSPERSSERSHLWLAGDRRYVVVSKKETSR